MFYQEALPKIRLLSRVNSLLTIRDRHWRNVAATFKKAKSANSLPFARNRCFFMWVPIFVWVLINTMWVVVIKMGAYIHGVHILCGCLLSRFYGTTQVSITGLAQQITPEGISQL